MDRPNDPRKVSIYLDPEMVEELERESRRLRRSRSWVVRRAWKIARAELQKAPAFTDAPEPPA